MKFNKIKLIAALCLALGVSALGQNNVGTLVTDPIRPFSVNSINPSAIANEIKGGPFSSSNLVGLSNIPAPRLEIGAIGYATNTGLYYRLTSTDPATWSSINGANITNIAASNVVGAIFGIVAISNGGTGATNAAASRTNLQAAPSTSSTAGFGVGHAADRAISLINNDTGVDVLFYDEISGDNWEVSNPSGFRDAIGIPLSALTNTNNGNFRSAIELGATNNAFVGLSVGTDNTNLSVENSSAFGLQNFIDSTVDESFAFGFANNISNMPAGAGGSIVMGGRGNMTNQGAFLFNGVPQGGAIGNSRGNNTFAVNASNGIYLNGSLFLEAVQGGSTDVTILQIGAGGGVSRTMTNKSTAVPAFFGWSGFSNTAFSAAEARTNIGLSFAALTNTTTSGFNASLYGTNTNPVLVNSNGEVVSPTNFWQVAPIVTRFVEFDPPTNATTNIVAARNLHIHSLAISRTGVTSTIALPTNSVFNGDIALVVHQGPTSSVTAIRQAGAGTNLITLNQPEEAVEFVYYNSVWQFNHNQAFIEPIFFSGTNASANAAASRANLGLGATNNVIFQQVDAQTFFVDEGSITFSGDAAATTRTNLGLGTTNSVSFVSIALNDTFIDGNVVAWDGNNRIQIEERKLLGGDWEVDGGAFNIVGETNKATTRTNLGLGATNNVTFNDVVASGTLTATSTVTAKTNLVVEGFVNYTEARTNNTPTNIPNFAAHEAWIEVKIGTNSFFLPAYQ